MRAGAVVGGAPLVGSTSNGGMWKPPAAPDTQFVYEVLWEPSHSPEGLSRAPPTSPTVLYLQTGVIWCCQSVRGVCYLQC